MNRGWVMVQNQVTVPRRWGRILQDLGGTFALRKQTFRGAKGNFGGCQIVAFRRERFWPRPFPFAQRKATLVEPAVHATANRVICPLPHRSPVNPPYRLWPVASRHCTRHVRVSSGLVLLERREVYSSHPGNRARLHNRAIVRRIVLRRMPSSAGASRSNRPSRRTNQSIARSSTRQMMYSRTPLRR